MPKVLPVQFLLAALFSAALAVGATHAASPPPSDKGKIKKCKDEEGNWHYGDRAADECAQSKIVEMSEKGTKRRVIAAPLTKEELAEQERNKEALAREAKEKKDQAQQDKLLLSTYANEDDINFIRDRKIAQIESQIKATEETLKPMRAALERMEKQSDKSPESKQHIERTKAQITRHEAVIAEKRKEQDMLRKKYAAELERYRELRSRKVAEPQSKK